MGRRLTILLVAFAITGGATVAALVVMRHGSLSEIVAHPPPKNARFDDPTLAAAHAGSPSATEPPRAAAPSARDAPPPTARDAPPARRASRPEGRHAAAQTRGPAGAHRHDRGGATRPLTGHGDLLVVCRPSCRVYVDGHPRGHTPPLRAIALPVGSHRLRVVGPIGHVHKRLVLVAPNRVSRVTEVFGDGKPTRSFRQETGTEGW